IHGDKEQSACIAVAELSLRQQGPAIGDRSPQDSMSTHVVCPTDIARVGTANVSAQGTIDPLGVIRRGKKVVYFSFRVAAEHKWRVGSQHERCAVRPATDELRCELRLRYRASRPLLPQKNPKAGNVLLQLAKHHKSAALAQ